MSAYLLTVVAFVQIVIFGTDIRASANRELSKKQIDFNALIRKPYVNYVFNESYFRKPESVDELNKDFVRNYNTKCPLVYENEKQKIINQNCTCAIEPKTLDCSSYLLNGLPIVKRNTYKDDEEALAWNLKIKCKNFANIDESFFGSFQDVQSYRTIDLSSFAPTSNHCSSNEYLNSININLILKKIA
jgi:hypothetical protein